MTFIVYLIAMGQFYNVLGISIHVPGDSSKSSEN